VDLDTYSRYCGPASIASVLGVDRLTAAEILAYSGWDGRCGGTHRLTMKECLEWFGCMEAKIQAVLRSDANLLPINREDIPPHRRHHRTYLYPTVAQWLRANPEEEAILITTTHYLHVRNGEIIEDNGTPKKRGRVGSKITFCEKGTT